jgi:hypothetical protein
LDFVSGNDEFQAAYAERRSPIRKLPGADEVFDKDVNIALNKFDLKAKRKDLKSANVKNLNERVL